MTCGRMIPSNEGRRKDGIKEKGIRQGNDRSMWPGGTFDIDQHYFFGCFMDESGFVKMQLYDFGGSLFCIDWWNLGHTLMQKLLT